jgi:hypothetical protein
LSLNSWAIRAASIAFYFSSASCFRSSRSLSSAKDFSFAILSDSYRCRISSFCSYSILAYSDILAFDIISYLCYCSFLACSIIVSYSNLILFNSASNCCLASNSALAFLSASSSNAFCLRDSSSAFSSSSFCLYCYSNIAFFSAACWVC